MIEVSRSISEVDAEKFLSTLPDDLHNGSVVLKLLNNEVWRQEVHSYISDQRLLRVTAATKREQLKVNQNGKPIIQFSPLSPSFHPNMEVH